MLSSKNICLAFGSVFVLVGLLGFFPNPLVSSEGVFETNTMHNFVHLLTGSAFLFGGLGLQGREDLTLKTIATAYLGVAIVGFLTSGTMLVGLVHINEADRWLHLGLAIAMIITAWGLAKPKPQFVQ